MRPGPFAFRVMAAPTGHAMKRRACLVLACALIPACAVATATRAGGVDFMRFDFADAPGQFQPVPDRVGMTRFSILDAISFEGAAGPARLVVKLALPPGAAPGAQPVDARVTYRPDGFSDFWQTADMPGPDAFAFTRLELSGPAPQIVGTFQVLLCRRASVMVPADPETCQRATGAFATELQTDRKEMP